MSWINTPGLELEATRLSNCWAVRPKGALGTMGWSPVPWTVVYVKAATESDAIRRARNLAK